MIILAVLTLCTECLSTQMKSQCQSKKRKKVLNKEREAAHKAKRGKSGKTSLPINGIGTVALYKKWRCEKIKTDKVLSPVDQRKAVAGKDKKQQNKRQKTKRVKVKSQKE